MFPLYTIPRSAKTASALFGRKTAISSFITSIRATRLVAHRFADSSTWPNVKDRDCSTIAIRVSVCLGQVSLKILKNIDLHVILPPDKS